MLLYVLFVEEPLFDLKQSDRGLPFQCVVMVNVDYGDRVLGVRCGTLVVTGLSDVRRDTGKGKSTNA